MTRIKPSDAATMLGVPVQSIRIGLQKGLLPFGTAVKCKGRYTYLIYPGKLEEFVGKEVYNTWKQTTTS